jgi:Domain of unknown function (DUF2017)
VVLTRLDLFCCELLHQIPVSAECEEGDAAGQRLYSSPTHGADPESDEDWKEYVAPELRDLFRSAMDVVREDLTDFPPAEPRPYYVLKIPVEHLRNWINALNQARLALAARYDVTEEDMERMPERGDVRSLAIFQIHFYGFLQECFLRELGGL